MTITNALAEPTSHLRSPWPAVFRVAAWMVVATTLVYVVNAYFIFWQEFPGVSGFLAAIGLTAPPPNAAPSDGTVLMLGALQVAAYFACLIGPILYVHRTSERSLRADGEIMSAFGAFIVRAAFWAVVLVGLADMIISFLRVEAMLEGVFGTAIAADLGRPQIRGTYVHLPLIMIGIAIAFVTRSLGFTWLALLVVVAELQIVLTRFVFSYEQAFQGDVVRFWYAALFLFASAYTLIEEGHVRVDVVYAGLSRKTKGLVNAFGCVFLGMTLCWTILILGMWDRTNIIVSPILSFEVSQSGFGMYVKYLMAGFLGVFAVTMMIQFAAYLLQSVADYRGDPGHREFTEPSAH